MSSSASAKGSCDYKLAMIAHNEAPNNKREVFVTLQTARKFFQGNREDTQRRRPRNRRDKDKDEAKNGKVSWGL